MTEIYRGMDQVALDREYHAAGTVPSLQPFLERYADMSAQMRATLPCHLDVAYGPTEAETMDVFPVGPDLPAGRNAPVFVFVHGGYWRRLSKADSSFMADVFTQAGVTIAAVNYALAPEASLDEIVRQCRTAVAWLHVNGREFGIDPDRIYIGGSSAGGHLVGMLLAQGWHELFGVPVDVVKGAMSASGLYDLAPVRLCEPNDWLNLDSESVARNSPLLHLPNRGCPLIVTWGGSETSEFKRQSNDYAAAWAARGFPCTAYEISDRNHFDIILDLADPASRLAEDTLAMIGSDQARGALPSG